MALAQFPKAPSWRRKRRTEHGIKLEVVKLPTAKKGFVLSPRRWVVETLAGLHFLAFVILMLKNVAEVLA